MTAAPFKVACVQTNSVRDIAPNVEFAVGQIHAAGAAGADFIALPECVSMMEPAAHRMRENTPGEADHPALAAFKGYCRTETTDRLLALLDAAAEGQ